MSPRARADCRSGWARRLGPIYGEDIIDARLPTPEEAAQLEMGEGQAVLVIKGTNRDQEQRVLHYIVKVTVGGRMQYAYGFGVVPE